MPKLKDAPDTREPKKPKGPTEYEEAYDAQEIGNDLIDQYHPHLKGLKIQGAQQPLAFAYLQALVRISQSLMDSQMVDYGKDELCKIFLKRYGSEMGVSA